MQYLVSFLEGIITFISPCLLPMLPIYISYFAGGGERTVKRTLTGACGFILGFTLVFTAMGALAGTLGSLVNRYQTAVNIVSGLVVVVFGLNYMGLLRVELFKGANYQMKVKAPGFASSLIFGIIFSLGWTPCVGAFLGSALTMASREGEVLRGILMLLAYSAGLGIPFIISAVLIDKLKSTFDFIKKHYRVINTVSGCLLILIGIFMATGLLGRFLTLFS